MWRWTTGWLLAGSIVAAPGAQAAGLDLARLAWLEGRWRGAPVTPAG